MTRSDILDRINYWYLQISIVQKKIERLNCAKIIISACESEANSNCTKAQINHTAYTDFIGKNADEYSENVDFMLDTYKDYVTDIGTIVSEIDTQVTSFLLLVDNYKKEIDGLEALLATCTE